MEMGAAAKAAAGLFLAAGGGAGAYYGYKHLTRETPKTEQDTPQEETIAKSKFDEALTNFLGVSGQDIIFEVKTGDNFETDLSDSSLGTLTKPIKVRARVKVTEAMNANDPAGNNTFKFTKATNEAEAPLKAIKDLNGGKPWTWSCEIELKKATSGASKSALHEETKKQIMDAGDKGLFGILKKNVQSVTDGTGNEWTKATLIQAKKDFVDYCSGKRAQDNAKVKPGTDLAGEALNITVPAFEFIDGKGNGKEDKLVAKDEEEFKKIFKEDYRTKNYKAN